MVTRLNKQQAMAFCCADRSDDIRVTIPRPSAPPIGGSFELRRSDLDDSFLAPPPPPMAPPHYSQVVQQLDGSYHDADFVFAASKPGAAPEQRTAWFCYFIIAVSALVLLYSFKLSGWTVEPFDKNPCLGPNDLSLTELGASFFWPMCSNSRLLDRCQSDRQDPAGRVVEAVHRYVLPRWRTPPLGQHGRCVDDWQVA
jgi:hypothetical protein